MIGIKFPSGQSSAFRSRQQAEVNSKKLSSSEGIRVWARLSNRSDPQSHRLGDTIMTR